MIGGAQRVNRVTLRMVRGLDRVERIAHCGDGAVERAGGLAKGSEGFVVSIENRIEFA